ncbi:2OG-Fe dioxygenase family protein [Streptomyces tubbatahanensis]|uniref:2OG-Fe dioxygenase family protein n=1 Tax=Streptomyces tubbatahanensis TaxID=2923272 RepID=A0ABY3XSD5_9ACTN|nr:2OG-Fe dioxygenase family protein [Streptomyces tubbatahanensis]UNS97310.1 2OG-Fe dioxygenase family protein [Streptomyces tubbatahanensis]
MVDIAGAQTEKSAGEVAEARQALLSRRAHVMRPATLSRCVGADETDWSRFASHWEDLEADGYAARHGTRRLRRYGHFLLDRTGVLRPMPHLAFAQPEETNRLHVGEDRHFAPLTDAFVADPLFTSLTRMLGQLATCLHDADEWSVKVHPFRVVASADADGQPTPEGRHRDGVTLVTSLMIGRENAVGGQSTVTEPDGTRVLATTLHERGTLLLGDDRATWHEVDPVRPADGIHPARRDVLVTTLTAHRNAERDAQVG